VELHSELTERCRERLVSLVAGRVRIIATSSIVVPACRRCTDRCCTDRCGTDTGTPTGVIDAAAIGASIGATVIYAINTGAIDHWRD
jgi:hypothetical protein